MRKQSLVQMGVATIAMTTLLVGCDQQQTTTKLEVKTTHKTGLTRKPEEVRRVTVDTGESPVVSGIRKFPYPYDAMLALSSDADSETLRKFNLVHEFINTTQMTPMGRGLGLDYSDSFFMYDGNTRAGYVDINHEPMADELSFFKGVSSVPYAETVLNHYIQVGWIDTMHTYGDFSGANQNTTLFRRQLAIQAINALKANGDHIVVWTDHGNKSNVDNFGAFGDNAFSAYQQGANPWSPYYHTDWTIPYGIQFVWSDTTSDQFGKPSVIFPLKLPDGRHVWGFTRYTNEGYTRRGYPEWNWSPYDLNQQLSAAHLDELVKHQDYVVVAQHLSGTTYPGVLPVPTRQALRQLAQRYYDGTILVARTSRLLEYNVMQQYVSYNVTYSNGEAYIHVQSILDPVLGEHVPTLDDIRGLTFYTSNPSKTILEIGDKAIPVDFMQQNKSDGRQTSISVRWFSPDTTNYASSETGVY